MISSRKYRVLIPLVILSISNCTITDLDKIISTIPSESPSNNIVIPSSNPEPTPLSTSSIKNPETTTNKVGEITNFKASKDKTTSIELSWDYMDTGDVSFKIFKDNNENPIKITKELNFIDTDITDFKEHSYRMVAFNEVSESSNVYTQGKKVLYESNFLNWNEFKDEENKELDFDRISWFSENIGMGVVINGSKAKLYKTIDAGKSWIFISEIDGKNTANQVSMDVYIFSENNIWYSTGFSGFGFSGTIGKSVDGGKTWIDLTEVVHKAFSEEGDSVVYDFPIWNIVKSKNKLFVSSSSNYIVVSSDNGDTWSKLKTPYNINEYQSPKLIGTPDYMYLYYFNNKVNTIFIYDDNQSFIESASKLPDTGSILNIRYSPLNNGVVFFNEKYGDDIFLYSTMDGANNFEKTILKSTKDDPLVEIRDIQRFYKNNKNELYVSGIFKGIDGNNYVQIRKSINNDPLKVIYSHEHWLYQNKLTSVMIDNLNNIHALKHWTDYYGYEYNYVGNFLLEK